MDHSDGSQNKAHCGLSHSKRLGTTLFTVFLLAASHATVRADSSVKDSPKSISTVSGTDYIKEECATNYCYQTVCFATPLQLVSPIKIDGKDLAQFSSDYDNDTKYGCAKVSLPRQKQRGEFPFTPPVNEKGFDVARREKEIVLNQIDVLPKETFQYVLKTAMASRRSDIPLFVHGYNTDFNHAVARAAQLAYDMGIRGPILLFPWPAADKPSLMFEAFDNVSPTEPFLIDFLEFLAHQDVIQRINIMAHSLGAKLVLDSLSRSNGLFLKKMGQIILAAPLITTARLKRAANELGSRVDRVTIFCSTDDRAIWLATQSFSGPLVASCGGLEELSLYSLNNRSVEYNRIVAEYQQRVRIDIIDITNSKHCAKLDFSCTHSRYA